MDIRLIVSIIFLLNMVVIYGFTVDVTPQNNSIVNSLTPTISAQITSPSNTSTFIDWDNSLVGYWNFDSGNSTHAYDLSGNQNHASFINVFVDNISYSNISQIRGQYVNSSGGNQRIEIEHRAYYNLYERNTTYSFWFRPRYPFGSNKLISKENQLAGNNNGFRLENDFGRERIRLIVHKGPGQAYYYNLFDNSISNNSWHHFVLTTDVQGTLNLYLNSVSLATNNNIYNGNTISSNNNLSMILLDDINSDFDELMIFNRTLSANEVGAIYNSQVNDFTFMPQDIANLNQYNYTLYTINESGFLDISNYSFFVNYTGVNTNSLFPSQAVSSYLVSILLLFMFFRNNWRKK